MVAGAEEEERWQEREQNTYSTSEVAFLMRVRLLAHITGIQRLSNEWHSDGTSVDGRDRERALAWCSPRRPGSVAISKDILVIVAVILIQRHCGDSSDPYVLVMGPGASVCKVVFRAALSLLVHCYFTIIF